jgi:hypothetical protein
MEGGQAAIVRGPAASDGKAAAVGAVVEVCEEGYSYPLAPMEGTRSLTTSLAYRPSSQRMSAAAMVEELEYEGLTNNDSVAINMAAGAMAGPSSRSLTSQDRTCCSCDSFSRYRRARRHVPHRQSQGRPTTL